MSPPLSIQFLLHLLQMILLDYPEAVVNGRVVQKGEYQEIQELCERALAVPETLPASSLETLPNSLSELRNLIRQRESYRKVKDTITILVTQIKRQWPFTIVPPKDLDRVGSKALFLESCAACHGLRGDGSGPASKDLDPKPTNFLNGHEMDNVSTVQLYNIIRFGLPGTAMPSFESLSEAQIWKLVFYVHRLKRPRH